MMKNESELLQERLLTANEKSRHLERQLHDKEREVSYLFFAITG